MESHEETKDLLRKLSPILSEQTEKLWLWNLVADTPESSQEAKSLLRILADRHAQIDFNKSIRLPPPEKTILSGEYDMGSVIYPEQPYAQIGLREKELTKHVLIVGMTGTGKTNLCLHLLQQLYYRKEPFLVFDWKNSYRKLKRVPGFEKLKVITIGEGHENLRFNPLIPPQGVDAKYWIGMIVDVIKHAFFVAYGPEYFFRKALDELYSQFGVYSGSGRYPTFEDIQKLLRKEYVRGRELLWMNSVKRVLAMLTFSGVLGDILNVREEGNLNWLFEEPVVLELGNLAIVERVFLVECLLLWLYHYRKRQGESKRLRHVTVIEEGHHVLSGRKEYEVGEESIMESVVRMIREYGESVIVLDQEPSKLSKSIVANSGTKINLAMGRGEDMRVMAESIGLGKAEQNWLGVLKVGNGMVKVHDRIGQPVLVRFPLVRLDRE